MRIYPRVAVLIESSLTFGRGVLAGIARYLHEHRGWSVYWEERGRGDGLPEWFAHWSGEGILARIESSDLARAIQAKKLPVVDLSGILPGLRLPLVQVDNAAVGQLAAQHFLERGYRHFAYCGFAGAAYSELRGYFFQQQLRRVGMTCQVFRPACPVHHAKVLTCERHTLVHDPDLLRWLRALPKPVALFACSDTRGVQVLRACQELRLTVPEEVAVLAVDNDEVLCQLADPPLSSVILNVVGIGYQAAALLDRLMQGQPPPRKPLLLAPLGIRARRSTEAVMVDDAEIAKAVRFIWAHACEGITIEDVVAECLLSRRTLERRFLHLLGHSPKTEILLARLQRVQQLLAETTLSIETIATQTGFHYPEYLYRIFKRRLGHTPMEYRSWVQQSALQTTS